MNKTEEKLLLEKADGGDKEALSKLADEGMRLSRFVAEKYKSKGNLEELAKAGLKGWTFAYKHYDRQKDYKFSTYSTWWIKQEIEKSLKS